MGKKNEAQKTFVKKKQCVSAPAQTPLVFTMENGINASSPWYQSQASQSSAVAPAPQKSPMMVAEFHA